MTPLQRIRENPEKVREMLEARGFDAPLDRILELDREVRNLRAKKERLQAERNKASRGGPPSDEVKRRMREVGDQIKAIDAELGALEIELNEKALWIPNEIDPRVPRGKDENDNKIIRKDEPKKLDLTPKPHWDVGESLGILDIPRAAKLSGSRFFALRGAGAALERALIAWLIDIKIPHGFVEVSPPFVTRKETLVASGHLPHFDENLYRDEDDDVWLIPTAETQLVSLHRDEVIPVERLPVRYVAYTPCFRREKMSAGRDVRGMKRVHQFDKVEMVVFCLPEDSPDQLEFLNERAIEAVERLGLPVRVAERCTGDLGFTALRGFDVDVWAPGVEEWLEVSSTSDCGSFQAERAHVSFRRAAGKALEAPHILNASGLGMSRLYAALVENYQQRDGSLVIPEPLRPYMGGRDKIAPGEFTL